MKTLSELGEQYQALRKTAGKTQQDVCLAVGMRQEALSRFERGRGADFSADKLLRLLQVLELQIEFTPTTRRPTLTTLLQERRSNTNVGPDSR